MIADSSVLILFSRAGRLELLFSTTGPLGPTAAVRRESIEAAPDRADAQALATAVQTGRLVPVDAPSRRVAALRRRYPNLGRGEVSVLAAGLEAGDPVVLLDEAPARRAAVLEGLQPVGSLGIVARAHRRGLLGDRGAVALVVRDLLAAGLWVAPDVVEAFWATLGGRE